LGGGAEKMPATVPNFLFVGVCQPQPGFMNESGRLKSLPCLFLGHASRSEFPHYLVNEWQKLFGSVGIPSLNRSEQLGNIGHSSILTTPVEGASRNRAASNGQALF